MSVLELFLGKLSIILIALSGNNIFKYKLIVWGLEF